MLLSLILGWQFEAMANVAAPYSGDTPWNQRDIRSDKFTDSMEEDMFQNWFGYHAKKRGLNPNPDDGAHHYDYRAAYKVGVSPDDTGHWPSAHKTIGHPNLIMQSDVPGQLVNTKTEERFWNPVYHGTGDMEALFNLNKRPPMIARPGR